MDYFLVLDRATFEDHIQPAFSSSWRQRSFEPCRALCRELAPVARSYSERYHTGDVEPLLSQVAAGLQFERAWWRQLVGELLLFTAVEIPELQIPADTLCCLLAPEPYRAGQAGVLAQASQAYLGSRAQFTPIQQALWGTRDLTFGAAVYRPEHAGLNNRSDVTRLADYLQSVAAEEWTVTQLAPLREAGDEEDRAEELALAQEWLPALVELFGRVRAGDLILAHESIY